eukprot:COSAG02_NODE_38477_length_428_cov_1.255319_1_plen_55_part_10
MLKVELENTRVLLAEMEAEVNGADVPALILGAANAASVADLLVGKPRRVSTQGVH